MAAFSLLPSQRRWQLGTGLHVAGGWGQQASREFAGARDTQPCAQHCMHGMWYPGVRSARRRHILEKAQLRPAPHRLKNADLLAASEDQQWWESGCGSGSSSRLMLEARPEMGS